MVATLADMIFTCRKTGTRLDILLPEVKLCFQGSIFAAAELDVQCREPFTILVSHRILQVPRDSQDDPVKPQNSMQPHIIAFTDQM
jgi:hypothetical protein